MEKRALGLVFIVEGNAERLFYESLVVSILLENEVIYMKKSENMNAVVSENLISTEYSGKKTYIYIKDCRSGSQLALQKDHVINIINKHFEAIKNFGIVFVCYDDETNKTRPYDEQDR